MATEPLRHKLLGLSCVCVCVCVWVSGGYLFKHLQANNYDKPFFIVFLSQSLCSILLLVLPKQDSRAITIGESRLLDEHTTAYEPGGGGGSAASMDLFVDHPPPSPLARCWRRRPSSCSAGPAWNYFLLALVLLLFRYLWPLSLRHTAVSLNTVLYNCYVVVVFLLSVVLLKEVVTRAKVTAVVLGLLGLAVICVATGGGGNKEGHVAVPPPPLAAVGAGSQTAQTIAAEGRLLGWTGGGGPEVHTSLLGVLLTAGSGMFYAVYLVMYRLLILPYSSPSSAAIGYSSSSPPSPYDASSPPSPYPTGSAVTASLSTLGYQSLAVFALGLPFLLFLHMAGIEPFALPDRSLLVPLIILSLQTLIYYSSLTVALVYTTPLVVSVGSIAVLPITVLIDFMAFGYHMSLWQAVGGAAVLASFVIITWQDIKGRGGGGGASSTSVWRRGAAQEEEEEEDGEQIVPDNNHSNHNNHNNNHTNNHNNNNHTNNHNNHNNNHNMAAPVNQRCCGGGCGGEWRKVAVEAGQYDAHYISEDT
eukprot:GHVS01085979.1.p1 GENE.GHVS01085979.1~~GHVS01085979.1.p1  ORF type:complete len:551 (+),score=166.74 GHVS01085979.1:63-1655(+)